MNNAVLFELELSYTPLTILIGIGLLGFIGAYFRWYLAVPALAFLGLLILFILSEDFAPDIYSVLQRQDPTYLPIMYVGSTISVILPILGAFRDLRRLWRINQTANSKL